MRTWVAAVALLNFEYTFTILLVHSSQTTTLLLPYGYTMRTLHSIALFRIGENRSESRGEYRGKYRGGGSSRSSREGRLEAIAKTRAGERGRRTDRW
jgi:hypothetical protein